MMARLSRSMDTRHPFNLHCAATQRCQGMLLTPVGRSRHAGRIVYRREVTGIPTKSLKTCQWGAVNSSCPWDGDTLCIVSSAPSGLEPPVQAPTCSTDCMEPDCRLGQRMSPRRRDPGAGPDPKLSTENHPGLPGKPFVPDGSLPLPLKQIFGYPWPVATPKSRGVTPFAGSICRQGASDAMPSISTTCTHSGPADCSVAPTSIHAAFHPAVHACRAASDLDSWD